MLRNICKSLTSMTYRVGCCDSGSFHKPVALCSSFSKDLLPSSVFVSHHRFIGTTNRNRGLRYDPVTLKPLDVEIVPPSDDAISPETLDKVHLIQDEIRDQIDRKNHGRLFAVVSVDMRQFKVTEEDIIIIQNYWPPQIGERINFEKVMLIGGADFTIVGAPMLDSGVARVEGIVIEKTLSHVKYYFHTIKRSGGFKRMKLFKTPLTMVRITKITFERGQVKPEQIPGQQTLIT